MKRAVSAAIVLTILSVGAVALGASAQSAPIEEKSGLIVPISEHSLDIDTSEIQQSLRSAGFDPDVEFALLVNRTGYHHVLVAQRELNITMATFGAYKIPSGQPNLAYIWYMDDTAVQFSDEPVPMRLSDLASGSDSWVGTLGRFESIPLQEVSWELESDAGVTYKQSVLGLGSTGLDGRLVRTIRNYSLAIGEANDTHFSALGSPLSRDAEAGSIGFGRESWWYSATGSTVVGIIENYDSGGIAATKSVTIESNQIQADRSSLESNVGDVVRFEASAVGTKTSIRDALIKASSCPPDMIGQGGVCVPAIVDATLHSGVFYTNGEILTPYIGVNNEHMDPISEPYSGHYQITGRVYNASDLDPRLESAIVLQVYEMEKIGDASSNHDVRDEAEEISKKIREQLTMNQTSWSSATAQPGSNSESGSSPEVEDNQTETGGSDTQDSTENEDSTSPGSSGPGFTFMAAALALLATLLFYAQYPSDGRR